LQLDIPYLLGIQAKLQFLASIIFPNTLATRGYVPWKQISSLIILVSTRLGNKPRIENTGSTSWKLLRSSSGHALDDDDDNILGWKFAVLCRRIATYHPPPLQLFNPLRR